MCPWLKHLTRLPPNKTSNITSKNTNYYIFIQQKRKEKNKKKILLINISPSTVKCFLNKKVSTACTVDQFPHYNDHKLHVAWPFPLSSTKKINCMIWTNIQVTHILCKRIIKVITWSHRDTNFHFKCLKTFH